MKLLAIPLAITLLLSTASACLKFTGRTYVLETGLLGGNLFYQGLKICYLDANVIYTPAPDDPAEASMRRNFVCNPSWLHAWSPRPRDGNMIVAFKNDLDGPTFGASAAREFTVGRTDPIEQGINLYEAKLECEDYKEPWE